MLLLNGFLPSQAYNKIGALGVSSCINSSIKIWVSEAEPEVTSADNEYP